MAFSKYISIILFLTCIFGCRKEEISIYDIDFSSAENRYAIVVEGGIFSDYDRQYIRLTKPGKWAETALPQGIDNAEVHVQEGLNVYEFAPGEESGDYFSVDSIRGEVGKTYTLVVSYEGKTYTATDSMVEGPETTNRIPVNDGSIQYFMGSNSDERITFNVYIHHFGYTTPRKWLLKYDDRDGSPMYNDLSRWHFNHLGSPPNGVFPSGAGSICCGALKIGTNIDFISLSMSDQYYEYLVSLFNETDWSAGLFSVIPGNIKTNLSEGGTGFFYASEVKRATYKVDDLVFY